MRSTNRGLTAALLCCVLWAVTCYAQTTAIRPDQIVPGTPDITTNMVGGQLQIGTTVPWRVDSTATPVLCAAAGTPAGCTASDAGRVVELTNTGIISATLPATGANNWVDGAGFTIQVGPGSLSLYGAGANVINGKTILKIGPYQSVGLAVRGGNWYANLSIPQPPTQSGTTLLCDNMQWAVNCGAPTITLGVKTLGAGAASITSFSVTLTGVTAGQLVTGEYWYCQGACTGGSGPIVPTSITSSTGGTCTDIAGARLWETAGSTTWGVGAFGCTGVGAGNPVLQITCPSDCSYLTIHAQSWNNASAVGTCTATNGTGTTGSTWTITSAAASVTGVVPISQVQPISATTSGTTTTNGTLLTDAGGRITSYLPPQSSTGPFTMNGNVSPNSAFAANIICVRP